MFILKVDMYEKPHKLMSLETKLLNCSICQSVFGVTTLTRMYGNQLKGEY